MRFSTAVMFTGVELWSLRYVSNGGIMRKNAISSVVGVITVACSLFAVSIATGATATGAATTSVDLSITGGTVTGFTHSGGFPLLPVSFTIRNNSTTTNAGDIAVSFKWRNTTTPSSEDYLCPLTSNHTLISPDTPACEPGGLAAGKTTGAALIVTPKAGVASVSVTACAMLIDGHTDPISSNNCKTVTISNG